MINAKWNQRLVDRPLAVGGNITEQKVVNELGEIGDRETLLVRELEAIRSRRATLLGRLPQRVWPSRSLASTCRISHTTIAAIRQKTNAA